MRAARPLDRRRLFAAPPRHERRLAHERPADGVRRPARPFDQERPHSRQTPARALSGARAGRRDGRAANGARDGGRARRPQRALVDRPAHALSERLRRAVEALARPGDDRLAARQRAGERAQIGAKAVARSAGSRRGGARRVRRSRRGDRRGPAPRIRPPRSASARAGPPRDRSASSRSRGRPRR